MAEEVKIRVTQEAQGSALDDAKKDLQELKQEAAKPTSAAPMIAPAPAATAAATQDSRTRKINPKAVNDLTRSAADFMAKGEADEKAAEEQKKAAAAAKVQAAEQKQAAKETAAAAKVQHKEERDAKATALREQRAADRQAATEKKTAEAEVARAAKTAATDKLVQEKAVTREHREQEAVVKARNSKLQRLGNAAANLAENAVGGSGFGGVTNALGGLGGGVGIAAGVGVAIAAAIRRAFLEQGVAEKIIGHRDTAARSEQGFQLKRLGGFEGSAGSAREEAMSSREEIVKRSADRARLEEEAKVRLWKPSTWLGGLTGSNQNPIRENEQAIQRAMEKEAAAKTISRKKFVQEGGREIADQQALAKGDVNRARAIEDALTKYREKIRLQRDGATEAEAEAGAEARVANIRRERAGQFGRFINSGTSAAAAARIATMAAQQSGMERDEHTGELIAAVNGNHREAMNAATRKKFSDLQ